MYLISFLMKFSTTVGPFHLHFAVNYAHEEGNNLPKFCLDIRSQTCYVFHFRYTLPLLKGQSNEFSTCIYFFII